jgi:hypothetical protein
MKQRSVLIILLALLVVSLASVAQASSQEADAPCYQNPRLWPGGTGRVTTYPNLPNRLRSGPSYSNTVLAFIPAGASFSVMDGPFCENGLQWWRVIYNGVAGWTVEGDGYTYYLEPVFHTPPITCVLPTRLTVFGYGRVTPGDPNVVRSAPGTRSTGANSYVIGNIPAGGIFSVLEGPQCGSDSRWWWRVNYNGLTGWTAEGEGYDVYWVEPWGQNPSVCPNALPSRLTAGGYGRVTTVPYLPNNIRTTSSYGGAVIGQIPAGNIFAVLSGPVCADNTAWWQVNYNGIVGWTGESNSTTYWLEPY